MTASLTQLLTVEQVAEHLQVPVATIYQWRHRGYGPPGFRTGRHVRYRLSDVEKWIDEQTAADAARAAA